ncbi:MAG: hypothetical protein WD768_02730 [Phycisphaeraceae bacterium]
MTRKLIIVLTVALMSSTALAEESRERDMARFTYRSIDAGTAEDLAQPREPVGRVRVVKAEPIRGQAKAITSTDSTATSNLPGSTGITVATIKAAEGAARAMTAPVQFIAPAAAQAAQAAAVAGYRPSGRVHYGSSNYQSPRVIYGNTYGTRSPSYYHGRIVYGSYANYHTGYYRPQTYVTSSYRTPSYCPPTYHAPTYYTSYSSHHHTSYPTYSQRSYCSTPRYYVQPSISFGYRSGGGYRSHCGYRGGSSFGIGFSFGW